MSVGSNGSILTVNDLTASFVYSDCSFGLALASPGHRHLICLLKSDQKVFSLFAGTSYFASDKIRSEAFSPIMTIAALVFPETRRGMMEPSAILNPFMPRTLSSGVTTLSLPAPMEQVPTG